MKTVLLYLIIWLCSIYRVFALSERNFIVQLDGFDKFDLAVATVRPVDQHADMLTNENELADGHIIQLEAGNAKIDLTEVPEHFILTVNLYLRGSKYELLPNWYAIRGDSILIKDNGSKQVFDNLAISGCNGELYSLQYELDEIVRNHIVAKRYPNAVNYFTSHYAQGFQLDNVVDKNIQVGKLVDKSKIDLKAKQWILAKMYYKIYAQFLLNPLAVTFIRNNNQRTKEIEDVFDHFKSLYRAAIRPKQLCLTTEYIDFYLKYLKLEAIFANTDKVDFQLRRLNSDFQGQALEHMGYAYLAESFYKINEEDRLKVLQWLLSITRSSDRMVKLADMQAIAAGMPFPDFELTDLDGKRWSKTDLLGKVVFFDFYYTGCNNCVRYFKNKASKAEEYFEGNTDVVFISISIDKDLDVWRKSVESGEYNSAHSLKLYTNGLGTRHPLITGLRVTAYPFPILMGRTGLIETSDSKKLGSGYSNTDALIKTIEKTLGK
ncbi:redoxin domain-containing protein [Sphingobacterium sp.]|uniref:TlpA family protein disulfide reductase n=1 Tax=Sphingobacterium sp. TaxID=341027 RepID=UPI0031DBBAC4